MQPVFTIQCYLIGRIHPRLGLFLIPILITMITIIVQSTRCGNWDRPIHHRLDRKVSHTRPANRTIHFIQPILTSTNDNARLLRPAFTQLTNWNSWGQFNPPIQIDRPIWIQNGRAVLILGLLALWWDWAAAEAVAWVRLELFYGFVIVLGGDDCRLVSPSLIFSFLFDKVVVEDTRPFQFFSSFKSGVLSKDGRPKFLLFILSLGTPGQITIPKFWIYFSFGIVLALVSSGQWFEVEELDHMTR